MRLGVKVKHYKFSSHLLGHMKIVVVAFVVVVDILEEVNSVVVARGFGRRRRVVAWVRMAVNIKNIT